jgi:hypothetical protein
MTKRNPDAPVVTPPAEQDAILATNRNITTTILEEHPTPAAMGAEAPPSSVSLELSASGPFGTY